MNSEVINAYNLCRGKVLSYKQQLLSRFSNDHVPIQYGVDYSSKIKPFKQEPYEKPLELKIKSIEVISPTEILPELKIHNEKNVKTYETVSKILFQKSPPINRRVIHISSKSISHQRNTNDVQSDSQNKNTFTENPSIIERPKVLVLSVKDPDEQNLRKIVNLHSPIVKDGRIRRIIGEQILSPVSEPEVVSIYNDKRKEFFASNKPSVSDLLSQTLQVQTMSTDTIDPTLVSVAQRAKSLMSNKNVQSANRSMSITPLDIQSDGQDDSVLSIKDRIRLFKDNLNQSANTSTSSEKAQRSVSNRFKTQPLSFDDIARANAMILDQSDVASTIASPSLTTSNETLVDFSEDSNSSSNINTETQKPSIKLRKSNAVLRAQSCLINQDQFIYKSIDEEEMKPTISVKEFIKNCDKKEEPVTQKIPKNAVVSRKLTFKKQTEKEEKSYKETKSYTKRAHLTQPITKIEMENNNMELNDSNQTIKDRIAQMQIQGENNWRNRLRRNIDPDTKSRPGSVVILQEQLQINNEKWKDRVEQKDVEEFTALNRLHKSMKVNNTKRFTIAGQALNDETIDPHCIIRLTRNNQADTLPTKQTLISDIVVDNESKAIRITEDLMKSDLISTTNSKSEILEPTHSQKVTVPHISDQSLSKFFSSSDSGSDKFSKSDNVPTNNDFDEIFLQSDLSLKLTKRTVKPTRNQKAPSRDILKKLNERSDIKNEYNETLTGVAERELKRCQIENIQSKAGFVEEALAGLTSKEDFSKIKLKRTESNKQFEQFVSPYKDLMLISVKGRKTVQVRLVEPLATSINIGDCYILSTQEKIFVWLGECANIIEYNKANELGSWIAKCKELNYKGHLDKPIIVKSDDSENSSNVLEFWKCLQCDHVQKINPPGDVSEDEIYEQLIQRTNMVYKVECNQLLPFDEYWGSSLKHKMLLDDQVFIFDFGTELYLWSGFKADMKTKTHGRNLLKMLYYQGYNYETCTINPLDPLPNNAKEAKVKKGNNRPNWVIVGRLPQKGETTLFKEKFSDWPESSRLIKSVNKSQSSLEKSKSTDTDLQPVDLGNLLDLPHPSVHITIDGKSVGRGGKWKVIEDGILREFSVMTKFVNMWHITDNEAVVVSPDSLGQFCSSDAYIIRWDYELKTLGRYTRNQGSGNLSAAYFFWQGSKTSITEKTASALLTINLDKDRATQIRVKQNQESPAFCRLFDGSMVVHLGKKRSLSELTTNKRLFIIRGEIESEAHLVEVSCQPESLRARSAFFLFNKSKKRGFVWFGNFASDSSKTCIQYCLKTLMIKKPTEFGVSLNEVKIEEIKQGKEPRTFWEDLDTVKRWKSSYNLSTLEPIRGWYVSAVTGVFLLTEMIYSLYPDTEHNIVPAFPLLQSYLYKSSQPALSLILTPSHIFLWEGWYVADRNISTSSDCDANLVDDDDSNLHNFALPKNRIAAEKLALLKSIEAWLNKCEPDITSSIVYAGLEPSSFQELFPFWEVNEDARNINIKRGLEIDQEDSISDTLHRYLSMKYSPDELRERPLPENVISSRIESYLTDENFEDLFKMTKEDFYDLPPWKQLEKKKEVNLF